MLLRCGLLLCMIIKYLCAFYSSGNPRTVECLQAFVQPYLRVHFNSLQSKTSVKLASCIKGIKTKMAKYLKKRVCQTLWNFFFFLTYNSVRARHQNNLGRFAKKKKDGGSRNHSTRILPPTPHTPRDEVLFLGSILWTHAKLRLSATISRHKICAWPPLRERSSLG